VNGPHPPLRTNPIVADHRSDVSPNCIGEIHRKAALDRFVNFIQPWEKPLNERSTSKYLSIEIGCHGAIKGVRDPAASGAL
jgi:hypothetical protein